MMAASVCSSEKVEELCSSRADCPKTKIVIRSPRSGSKRSRVNFLEIQGPGVGRFIMNRLKGEKRAGCTVSTS